MNESDMNPPADVIEPSETPIADSVPTYHDQNVLNALAEIAKAVNSMGEQLSWLCDSHYNILNTVGAIQEKMSSMGPGGMLKAMMGGGKGQ